MRSPRRYVVVGAAIVSLAPACSLISTRDLSGGSAGTTGDSCAERGALCIDASVTLDAPTCAANVQTDSENCGACGVTCGSGMHCAAATCVVGCPGGVMFVSAESGNDAFDGCSGAKPKRTVNAALTRVRDTPALASEIHVCRGTYTEEQFTYDVPVSLRGSYDCTAWTRTKTFGYPTFDGTNLTTLAPSAVNITGVTVSIQGNPLGPNVQFDGFRALGPATTPSDTSSEAIEISSSATLTVRDNEIFGAKQSATDTRGLAVSVFARPTVTANHIDGGGGDQRAAGVSFANHAQGSFHGNLVTTGASSGGGAIGVLVEATSGNLTGAYALTGNTIETGAGTGIVDAQGTEGNVGSAAVYAEIAVDVIGNILRAGPASCPAGSMGCASFGVHVNGAVGGVTTVIAGNRIVTGTATTSGGTSFVAGIDIDTVASAQIVNNAIAAVQAPPAKVDAIRLASTVGAVIVQNTLFGSSVDLAIDPGSSATAKNNLFLGDPTTSTYGAFEGTVCSGSGTSPTPTAPLVAFTNNAFLGFGSTLADMYQSTSGACVATPLTSFDAIAAVAPSAMNDVRVAATCDSSDAPTCLVRPACTEAATTTTPLSACITTVLGNWDDATEGVQTLLDETQTWKLGSSAPCAITQGGVALIDSFGSDAGYASGSPASVNVDIDGKARTAPFSTSPGAAVRAGAYEDDGPCR